MDLAGEQQWIQRHPEIVDDDVVDDLDEAGGGIDLDLGEMGAVRVGAVGAGEGRTAVSFDGSTSGRLARSAKLIERSVPTIRTRPSLISRSPGLVSKAWAAISRKFLPSSRVARSTQTPPVGIADEPPVPRPVGIRSVSP